MWPSVGYNDNYELSDEDKRKENGLKEIPALPRQSDSVALARSLFDTYNHSIRFEAVLSTSPDQIAIAPGYLQREWNESGRRYFHYKMDRPISNFYSIISARYSVHKEKHKGIAISVYHHPSHTFNVKKMAESVKHSLDYYQKNFSPYQHRQVRILEFPRYSSFAQSFDNTIPYSEGIGFIADLKEKDAIDYVYFVTAHEMAHQWWGHQINPAFVRGGQFLSETMAEYSALMVMRERYGDELMGRFLRRELNGYLGGRSSEKRKEDPLMDIEFQGYAYYNKGSLAMYKVMSLLGEPAMNSFLGEYIRKYAFAERPYPNTHDFYQMLQTRFSPIQKELADDQLKKITLFKNRMVSANGKKLPDGSFEVRMKVELGKMYVDSTGGNEQKAEFKGPIELALLMDKSPKKKSDLLRFESVELKNGQEIRWTSKQKPVYAALDPFYTFTDILPEDNQVKIDWE
jgi:aminopeptidase N